MILIIEGMDRVGKTTLISNLRKNYLRKPKTLVHHSSSPPNIGVERNNWEISHYSELAKTFHLLSAVNGYDIICDRFHIGASVYGEKFRGLESYKILQIDSEVISNGLEDEIFLVLLTDFAEKILERDDGQSIEATVEEFEFTRLSFINFFTMSTIKNKIHINITENGGFENTYPKIVDFLVSTGTPRKENNANS